MTVMGYDEMESPIGTLTLAWRGDRIHGGLCHIEFGSFTELEMKLMEWSQRWYGTMDWKWMPETLSDAAGQLRQYFAGSLRRFDLPLDLQGTPFQLKVWKTLTEIPYGSSCSYKDIAKRIDMPKAFRAVGGANNRNPIPIIVPCHRVIGANGDLIGYGGGLSIKTLLLQHEGYLMKELRP